MDISIHGVYSNSQQKFVSIPEICNPGESTLIEFLEILKQGYGFLEMHNNNDNDQAPQNLQLYTDFGRYMLLFGVIEDEEYEVKTLCNPLAPATLIDMHGEPFPARAIVNDFQPIAAACLEFLRTGNVVGVLLI